MENSSQVGVLVPLNDNLEEDSSNSIPRVKISKGTNVLGRDVMPITEKRLSRKHLSITVSVDGSTQVAVEGTNPVVIRSQDQRKKLLSREKLTIKDGDIIELIPGHYLFKYKAFSGAKKRDSPDTQKRPFSEGAQDDSLAQKRLRQVYEDEALARKLQSEMNNDIQDKERNVEEICNFKPPKDKIPQTFRLMRVKGLQPWANTNSVSIGDVIQGNVLVAVLSNYMVDLDWLMSACPTLKKIPLVVHGESDGRQEHMKKNKPANCILHKPSLPIAWGTHHSKAMFLLYPQGVRVIVHTANLIYVDWNNKSQGLWMQDFPWKNQDSSDKGSGFESDLIDYLSALKLGVLFFPSATSNTHAFSCTENGSTSENNYLKTHEAKRTKLVTLASPHSKKMHLPDVITLPVPYELPLQKMFLGRGIDNIRGMCWVKFGLRNVEVLSCIC